MPVVPLDPRLGDEPWGLLHPTDSGILWQVRTAGSQLAYRNVEGVFFPLPRPMKDGRDLLQKLQEANREQTPSFAAGSGQYHDDIWSDIQDDLGFSFNIVSPPSDIAEFIEPGDGVVENVEGLLWIEIVDVQPESRVGWVSDLPRPLAIVPGNSD